ncbi:unnamed protein product [Amoebophrya sp. A120]|nr:unnamed protein product [Amoebophrya sp. A120]|eukprot:GSA120T00014940001.1
MSMNDERTIDVNFKLCEHTDAGSDGSGPWPGSLQFYLQRAYHQTETQQLDDINSGTLTNLDSDEAKRCLESVLLEIDLHDEKPWRADRLADFFNYDLNERSFREYVRSQIRMRFENRQRTTLGSVAGPSGYLGQGKAGKGGGYGGYGGGYGAGKGYGKKGYDSGPYGGGYDKGGGYHGGDDQWGGGKGMGGVAPLGMNGVPDGGKDGGKDDRRPGSNECESIYVIGFPPQWSKDDLRAYFQQFGMVTNSHVIPPQGENQRPAGIVNFVTVQMARESIAQCNGRALPGAEGAMEVKFKMPGRRELNKGHHGKKGGQNYGYGGGDKGGGPYGQYQPPMGSPNQMPLGGAPPGGAMQ